MPDREYIDLLAQLLKLPQETEWLEFKLNNTNPEEIGEYISALANSAALHGRETAYIVWGVEDESHAIRGTSFRPREAKVGNEELESWLARLLSPRIDFKIHELDIEDLPVVIFEIKSCLHTPVRFKETEFVRVGSYKKKLKDYPEKERSLWARLSAAPFERQDALTEATGDEVLQLLDYPAYFDLTEQKLPDNKAGILERLEREKLTTSSDNNRWTVTNLGAILFGKRLADFDSVARKAVRVVIIQGEQSNRNRQRTDWHLWLCCGVPATHFIPERSIAAKRTDCVGSPARCSCVPRDRYPRIGGKRDHSPRPCNARRRPDD